MFELIDVPFDDSFLDRVVAATNIDQVRNPSDTPPRTGRGRRRVAHASSRTTTKRRCLKLARARAPDHGLRHDGVSRRTRLAYRVLTWRTMVRPSSSVQRSRSSAPTDRATPSDGAFSASTMMCASRAAVWSRRNCRTSRTDAVARPVLRWAGMGRERDVGVTRPPPCRWPGRNPRRRRTSWRRCPTAKVHFGPCPKAAWSASSVALAWASLLARRTWPPTLAVAGQPEPVDLLVVVSPARCGIEVGGTSVGAASSSPRCR